GKRPGTTTGPINQHLLPRLDLSFVANPPQSDQSRFRDGRCFLEGQTGWFECQGFFGNADILGKATRIRQDVPKYFVPWLKLPDIFASHFNPPGDVRSEDLVTWLEKPPDAGIQRFADQVLPVRSIDGRSLNLDQDFIVRRG